MTLTELLARPEYAGLTDAEAAAAINAATVQSYRTLSTRDLLRWGFGREGLSKLRDAVDRVAPYTAITGSQRAQAIAAYAVLTQGIDGELDVSDPEIDGMLDLLVSTGIFTVPDKAALLTRAQVQVPMWQTLEGFPGPITADDVAHARAG